MTTQTQTQTQQDVSPRYRRKEGRDNLILRHLQTHSKATLAEMTHALGYPEASISCGMRTLRNTHGIPIDKVWNVEACLWEYSLANPLSPQ